MKKENDSVILNPKQKQIVKAVSKGWFYCKDCNKLFPPNTLSHFCKR